MVFIKGQLAWNKGMKGWKTSGSFKNGDKPNISSEARKRAGSKLKAKWANGDMKGMLGKKHSPETLEKKR